MKIKIIKKEALLILVATLLLMPALNAGEFRKLYDMSTWHDGQMIFNSLFIPTAFKQYGYLSHFPIPEQKFYVVIDRRDGFKKVYTSVNTDNQGIDFMAGTARGDFMNEYPEIMNQKILKSHNVVLFVHNAHQFPIFNKWYWCFNLPGKPQLNYFSGFTTIPVSIIEDNVYVGQVDCKFYTDYGGLYKSNNSLTELLGAYPFPGSYRIRVHDNQHIILGIWDNLWITTNAAPGIADSGPGSGLLEFDILKEEWIIYDSTNLPFKWVDVEWCMDTMENKCTSFAYVARTGFLDWNSQLPKPIVPIVSQYRTINDGDTTVHNDNALLYFNRTTNQFDTLRIELEGRRFTITRASPIYALRKIVINISAKDFILYDWETKTYELVAPPDSMLTFFDTDSSRIDLRCADLYIDSEGNQCIGLLYNNGDFFIYNPNPTSIDDIDGFKFPDLWFRSVYPNPITQNRTVSANIMCYLQDISAVELGLYNFMGQKILDLSEQFEHEPSTATIHLTFELPATLSKGIYFLTVRNGKETRTQPIVIGE